MQKYYTFPSLNIRTLWKRCKENNPILDRKELYLYASGRAALFYGVSCLPLEKGQKVLLPSYHCGVEVEAILRAGFSVDFYPVSDQLEADVHWLEQYADDDCAAIVVIHYYGFPQPIDQIKKICAEKKLYLIEDCAHGLYSKYRDKWLGRDGDISIYSIQKTVCIPNGGGLLVNANLPKPGKGRSFIDAVLIKGLIRSVLEYEVFHKSKAAKISKIVLDRFSGRQADKEDDSTEVSLEPEYYDVPCYDYRHDISILSKPFLRPRPFVEIIKQRRSNYQYLQDNLSFNESFFKVHEKLPDGVCPLCFPVNVDDNDKWSLNLRRFGVYEFIFGRFSHPAMDQSLFHNVEALNQGILGLPVHQQLSRDEMVLMVRQVNKAIARLSE